MYAAQTYPSHAQGICRTFVLITIEIEYVTKAERNLLSRQQYIGGRSLFFILVGLSAMLTFIMRTLSISRRAPLFLAFPAYFARNSFPEFVTACQEV